jgi:hypothetical protein
MRSFRSDPYLWVHLAGVAAVPIFLELCLVGLGMGSSLMPIWFELLFVGGLGIAPILWMQWQKPFSIFSLLLLAVRSDHLSEDQRKILGLFKDPIQRVLSVAVAITMAAMLWQLYRVAPIAHGVILPSATRGVGLLWAAIAFFFANLFLQVPISVLRVLLLGDRTLTAATPYPVDQIPAAFTIAGFRVKKILPELVPKPSKPVIIRPVEPPKKTVVAFEEPEEIAAAIGVITETSEAIVEKSEGVSVLSEDIPVSTEDHIVSIEENPVLTENVPVLSEDIPVSTGDNLVATEDHAIPTEDDPVPTETHAIPPEDDPVPTEIEAIEQQETEAFIELEVIKLEEIPPPIESDPDTEDFGAEKSEAIETGDEEEDWGDDDLDDL